MKTSFKYGAHQFLWTENWTDKSLHLLEEANKLGLECFEISLDDDIFFDPRPVRRKAGNLNMEITVGPGNLWPMECDISLQEKHSQQLGLAFHRRIIRRTSEMGAIAYCGAIYGHPGNIIRVPRQIAEKERIVENIRVLADYARSLQVKLVLEPMSRFRTHILNTALDVLNLWEMVKNDNLLINLDTYHMITEERDYARAIRKCGPALWGIHACENDRGVPGGGLVRWKEVFYAMAEVSPAGRILMETYNTGINGFGFKRGIFQDVCPDAAVFVKQGLAFLKNCEKDVTINQPDAE